MRMPVLESMVRAVTKWISGKQTPSHLPTLLIPALLPSRPDAVEPIAVSVPDIRPCVTLMDVTSTLTAWVTPVSMDQVRP